MLEHLLGRTPAYAIELALNGIEVKHLFRSNTSQKEPLILPNKSRVV